MNQKIGRNDPCPCGSGKKYKQCCQKNMSEGTSVPRHKITAKWLNAPQGPNLMERTFGESIASTGRVFEISSDKDTDEKGDHDTSAAT